MRLLPAERISSQNARTASSVQGCLADKKCLPLGPYSRHTPTGSYGGFRVWAFSSQRGNPVATDREPKRDWREGLRLQEMAPTPEAGSSYTRSFAHNSVGAIAIRGLQGPEVARFTAAGRSCPTIRWLGHNTANFECLGFKIRGLLSKKALMRVANPHQVALIHPDV